MIGHQALEYGNYVGVTEISGAKRRIFFNGAPINLCCAPVPLLSEIWGRATASSMAYDTDGIQ